MRFKLSLIAPIALLLAACTTTREAHVARSLAGTWTHNIPWNDGRERTLTLKGTADEHGKLRFEFIQPPFSYKPVLTAVDVTQGRVEISFKMVLYADESDVSPHTLKYVLREKHGVWSGQFIQSWVSSPVDVTLARKA